MIKVYKYEGIDEEDCLTKCIEELDTYACDLFINNIESDEKYIIEVIKKEDIISYIKDYLKNLCSKMNLDLNLEVREEENIFDVTMVSNNNPILIGKDGKNLNSIQQLLRQSLKNLTNIDIKVNLDASNYKAKKVRGFEYQIKNIVREVQKTKVDTKLDPMNSYDRRVVHEVVSKFEDLETESFGESPNRYVVIRYKKD